MKTLVNGKLLKIYIGESDRFKHEALYHVIIRTIKEYGLAGATVLRGIEGFGAGHSVHTAHIEVLSQDLPLVIEVADDGDKIDELIEAIDPMMQEGMIVVMDDIQIIKYSK